VEEKLEIPQINNITTNRGERREKKASLSCGKGDCARNSRKEGRKEKDEEGNADW